jgi:hypothetical protein
MEAAGRWGTGGALVVMVLVSLCPTCDDGRALEVEELCPPAACDGGDCAPRAPLHCTSRQHDDAAAGSPSLPAPTDVIVPPCSVCVRAEACCKAAGLVDCHYVKACVSATPAVQRYYVAQCRTVIDASASGDKTLPDVCAF